ncbi:MAG: hypothetical protein LBQ86_03695 [Holophagales bacterium]|jgi:hypothetical protein|nr:hypothetical protein [Holophagales bacterium]
MNKMNCPNVKYCPCASTTCQNYGKCCACVASHREAGGLPACLRRNKEDGKN